MKIALLFPGQGSQYVGMGKKLCDSFAIVDQTFDEASEVLGFDLKEMCFKGDLRTLTRTENAQPALLTLGVAAFRVYNQEFGINPCFAAGHSLGEYTALACSGAIEFPNALRIVRKRGKFMQEAAGLGMGKMAAIMGLDGKTVKNECRKISTNEDLVVVSNFNSPKQIVISGHGTAVERACQRFMEMEAKITPLKVSAPFHSPLMEPAALKLKEELLKYNFKEFKWPVISNVTALPYSDSSKIIDNLTMQMTASVVWTNSMKFLQDQGVTLAIDMGSKSVLKNLMNRNIPEIKVLSFDKEEDRLQLKNNISSCKEEKQTVITKCLAIAVCTRNFNWDNSEYHKGVVEPYKRIMEMQNKLEDDDKEPTKEQMKEAIKMLQSVFNVKKVPMEEQAQRFNELFHDTRTGDIFKEYIIEVQKIEGGYNGIKVG